ncbi:MAG: hypothetical protein GOVbin556_35 [Prokaryotic dsDNA virus sp.]|nr:MAG: hypothetical protein GOVbin556_35 [Prokaryotic dsDNA virus sp.]|tara:strand:+ start:35998 stop:36237 length:240 start_codon:yes stop_codon:yes gene_type:complete
MNDKYFTRIETELNDVIKNLANNMLDAIKDDEWEAVLLSAGAIMDCVKTIYPTASGNLHRVMSGKYNGHNSEPNEALFG